MQDDLSSISTAKNIYENVQHASAARHGNALFQSFSTQSDGSVRERRHRSDATLRSSINTIDSFVATPASNTRGVSAMGHRLTYINAPEEEYGMKLDREEMKRLVIGQQEEEAEKIVDGAQQLGSQSIGSGLGTDGTKSVSRSTMIYSDESTFTKGASTASQRTLVLLGIGLLLGICLLFTFVNMSNKTHKDWIEPNKDAYLNEGKWRSISFQSLR